MQHKIFTSSKYLSKLYVHVHYPVQTYIEWIIIVEKILVDIHPLYIQQTGR